jgi:hypothetical protein
MAHTKSRPDPEAKVALLLCESLLHVLVEQKVISREAAQSAIQSVLELTQEEEAEATIRDRDVSPTALIEQIAETLAAKIERSGRRPRRDKR